MSKSQLPRIRYFYFLNTEESKKQNGQYCFRFNLFFPTYICVKYINKVDHCRHNFGALKIHYDCNVLYINWNSLI